MGRGYCGALLPARLAIPRGVLTGAPSWQEPLHLGVRPGSRERPYRRCPSRGSDSGERDEPLPPPRASPRSPVVVGAEALALPQHRAVQVQHLRAAGRRHLQRNTQGVLSGEAPSLNSTRETAAAAAAAGSAGGTRARGCAQGAAHTPPQRGSGSEAPRLRGGSGRAPRTRGSPPQGGSGRAPRMKGLASRGLRPRAAAQAGFGQLRGRRLREAFPAAAPGSREAAALGGRGAAEAGRRAADCSSLRRRRGSAGGRAGEAEALRVARLPSARSIPALPLGLPSAPPEPPCALRGRRLRRRLGRGRGAGPGRAGTGRRGRAGPRGHTPGLLGAPAPLRAPARGPPARGPLPGQDGGAQASVSAALRSPARPRALHPGRSRVSRERRVSARGARRAVSFACARGPTWSDGQGAPAGLDWSRGAYGVKDSVGTVSAPQARSGASLLLKLFPAKSSAFSEDANFPDSPYYPGGCGLLCSWNVEPGAGRPPLVLLKVFAKFSSRFWNLCL